MDAYKSLPKIFQLLGHPAVATITMFAGFFLLYLYGGINNVVSESTIINPDTKLPYEHHGFPLKALLRKAVWTLVVSSCLAVVIWVVYAGPIGNFIFVPKMDVGSVSYPKPPNLNLQASKELPKANKATVSKQEVGTTIPRTDKTSSQATPPTLPSVLPPATPMPEHTSPFPVIPPNVNPYDELKAIKIQVEDLNNGWKHDIQDAWSRAIAPNRVDNKLPMPTQLPDGLSDALAEDNLRATYDYENNLQPRVKKARDDANLYMQTTHTDQIDDDQRFIQANQQALTASSPSGLRKPSPYPDQFESITNYLEKLLRKLGTYPNTSKPLTR